jgi:hypothetical protein
LSHSIHLDDEARDEIIKAAVHHEEREHGRGGPNN